ncbi:MAG: glycoside hydrolase family 3 C-terminal domain-containing protein [Bacilli bacterium]|nr:glycoside hydrolase family 3 C-terminal domain-containing protein [Bacilli bacterium]
MAKLLSMPKVLPNKENAEVALKGAEEGIVLLRNDGVLPCKEKSLALFGAGAIDTIICGTGSGYVTTPYLINVLDGLKNEGYEITSESWLNRFKTASQEARKDDNKKFSVIELYFSGLKTMIDDVEITEEDLKEAEKAKTAIYVIRRVAGEGNDRYAKDGDYYLSSVEKENIAKLNKSFKKVIVVLNTSVIDVSYIAALNNVKGIIYLGLAGLEAGHALGEIISGKINPSGRLTDTWAKHYEDYPASKTFSHNDGNVAQEDYLEGIYVGYRYFDSFGIEPLFPFGFGLSYTTFERKLVKYTLDKENVLLEIAVKNIGACSGKDVEEIYVSAPEGKLDKPYQELKGYQKTKELKPGEEEIVHVIVPFISLASFSESDSAWLLEKGKYLFRLGTSSKETKVVLALDLDKTAILLKTNDVLKTDKPLKEIKPSPYPKEVISCPLITIFASSLKTKDETSKEKDETVTYIPQGKEYHPYMEKNPYKFPYLTKERVVNVAYKPNSTFIDVVEGKVSYEEFIASLDTEVLIRLVAGIGHETPYQIPSRLNKGLKKLQGMQSSGETTAQYVDALGIPNMYLDDGPTGLHSPGLSSTSFPVGTVAAQTWNPSLIEKLGQAYGKDMVSYHCSIALGPGMNIHRDPLCGRNFEYYSEDPLITGFSAAAFTKGVQSLKGKGVALKHFATNNQEDNRPLVNNTVSPRALREIYLKGFEIAVREADPRTIMTSYNSFNGMHTSSNRDLLMKVVRGEWGFKGFIMTDWEGASNRVWDLHAGNDILMGGIRPDVIKWGLEDIAPVFDEDGKIHIEMESLFGGYAKVPFPCWGSFINTKDGKDQISAVVKKDVEVSKEILPLVENGLAKIEEMKDGSKKVTYFGIHTGAYLPLGDVQADAIRILKVIAKSSAMDELKEIIRNQQ